MYDYRQQFQPIYNKELNFLKKLFFKTILYLYVYRIYT